MNEVEPIANDDEREQLSKLGLLEEVLNFLRIVEI